MLKHDVLESTPDFFTQLVKKEMAESGISASLEVKNYLGDLLQSYILADHLFSEISSSGRRHIKTLAELYLQTYSSSTGLKRSTLKQVGDRSLYMSGFFREALKRKSVSVDYYISMGKRAYQTLANLQNQNLFNELADRFLDLMFILFRIQKSNLKETSYILSLLNQYMETNSLHYKEELMRYGINLPFQKKGTTH